MNNISAARTQWHQAQENALRALKHLLSNWENPKSHSTYDRAIAAEKEAEFQYLKALAGQKTKKI